jgi:hypothetical protein
MISALMSHNHQPVVRPLDRRYGFFSMHGNAAGDRRGRGQFFALAAHRWPMLIWFPRSKANAKGGRGTLATTSRKRWTLRACSCFIQLAAPPFTE